MLLVGTDAQLLYPANTFLSTKANRSTPPLLQGQLGAGGMSYRQYENPLEPPMDQIPPALRAGAVDLAVGFIPGLRFGARQQLLFESDYVALARLGHPGVETISNVQGDFFAESEHAVARAEGIGPAIVERTLRKHGLDLLSQYVCRIFLTPPTIVGVLGLVATVPRPLGVLVAVAEPIEILSHPLKLPKLVIRQFWHERFDAEPALM